jgi:hypothetical protein
MTIQDQFWGSEDEVSFVPWLYNCVAAEKIDSKHYQGTNNYTL